MNAHVLYALNLPQWSLRTPLAVELLTPPLPAEQLLLQRILSLWELSWQDILCYYGEPAVIPPYLKCWSFVGEKFVSLKHPGRLILPTLQALLLDPHQKKLLYHALIHFSLVL